MLIKENYLSSDNIIEIKSYNYEKSNSFSQETSVDTIHGTSVKHKFVLDINSVEYSLNFIHSKIINKYAAMEDEWVEMEDVIEDSNTLIIKELDDNVYLSGYEIQTFEIKDFDSNIEEFKNKLIHSATEIGVGCNYHDHMNKEDDFARTYPDIQNSKSYLLYKISNNQNNNLLFIKDDEKELFEDFLNLSSYKDEEIFLKDKEIKFIEIDENEEKQKKEIEEKLKKQQIQLKKQQIIEERENNTIKTSSIVNPLFKEVIEIFEKKQYLFDNYKNIYNGDLEFLKDNFHESKETIDQILEHISIAEFIDVIENTNNHQYPSPRKQNPFDYPDEDECIDDYIEQYIDSNIYYEESFECESCFDDENEINVLWEKTKYSDRFKAMKLIINNELGTDIIPDELKEKFNIKNKSKSKNAFR